MSLCSRLIDLCVLFVLDSFFLLLFYIETLLLSWLWSEFRYKE